MNWTDLYESNYKNMITEVYKNNKTNFNPKAMYSKLALMANTNKLTDFLNPGTSFMITNEQAKQI